MKTRNSADYSFSDRLAAFLASMVFAVPTAFICWWVVNAHLAHVGGFVTSVWLWGGIAAFGALSLVSPRLFLSLLGAIWRLLYRLAGSL